MEAAGAADGVELEDRAADDPEPVGARAVLELPLEPEREGDVVRVEPRHPVALRAVEREVERAREALPLLVAEHDEARVVERREHVGGGVGRGVVDDHQLEVLQRLEEHARDRLAEERGAVAHGQQHRDEGHEGRR